MFHYFAYATFCYGTKTSIHVVQTMHAVLLSSVISSVYGLLLESRAYQVMHSQLTLNQADTAGPAAAANVRLLATFVR